MITQEKEGAAKLPRLPSLQISHPAWQIRDGQVSAEKHLKKIQNTKRVLENRIKRERKKEERRVRKISKKSISER